MRQIFLDTETTGLDAARGHRIIEVVALAYQDRRMSEEGRFHHFCNPRRAIEVEAQNIHGISAEFLADKPEFGSVAKELQEFLRGTEVIIHNAEFDCAFLDSEFARCDLPPMSEICGKIVCSLKLSRSKVPGLRRHRLEDLCRHFGVDDSARITHNAILDATLLAQVYFAMTRKQMPIQMSGNNKANKAFAFAPVLTQKATAEECAAHEQFLDKMENKTHKTAIWRR